mmetsp:Transcript_101497/g.287587  ORF Transcript_101497/g.287587 Transcript_101497/m.287587 type:complete len:233 (-) Transcript_101497:59-757(-)
MAAALVFSLELHCQGHVGWPRRVHGQLLLEAGQFKRRALELLAQARGEGPGAERRGRGSGPWEELKAAPAAAATLHLAHQEVQREVAGAGRVEGEAQDQTAGGGLGAALAGPLLDRSARGAGAHCNCPSRVAPHAHRVLHQRCLTHLRRANVPVARRGTPPHDKTIKVQHVWSGKDRHEVLGLVAAVSHHEHSRTGGRRRNLISAVPQVKHPAEGESPPPQGRRLVSCEGCG